MAFMKRDLELQLNHWKSSKRRKPLILRGARQVGKTHLLKAFGKAQFTDLAYFNFEEDPRLEEFFEGKLDPLAIIKKLSIYRGAPIHHDRTLIVLDEIQSSSLAITSLKYFSENASQYPLIAAGSLLGIKLAGAKSFPVGKVDFLNLYPLTFFEFLVALGKQDLRQYLEDLKEPTPIPAPFHEDLIDLLRTYFFVGGMPEAVETYRAAEDLGEVRRIQNGILKSYLLDFSKYAPPTEVIKITQIWNAIPSQLAKENKKFIFSAIAKSARAREYESAIQWLCDAELILKVARVEVPRFPLGGYADLSAFKVYFLDVGLLGALSHLSAKMILHGDALFTEFKGALNENFVSQELTTHLEQALFYWKSASEAEVDFLIEYEGAVIPLEVKSGVSAHSKSLKEYQKRFNPSLSVRISPLNLERQSGLLNCPPYLIRVLLKSLLA